MTELLQFANFRMKELKTFLDYLDGLFNDFEMEKRSKKVFDETAKSFKIKLEKVHKYLF